MRRILAIAACTTLLATGPAVSQDIGKALAAFGLVGTWSSDCGDKTKPRWIFTGGEAPALTFSSPGKEAAYDESSEGPITAAEIVSPTKISVTAVPRMKNGKKIDPASPDAKPESAVLEKVGDTIKSPDGPLLRKCGN